MTVRGRQPPRPADFRNPADVARWQRDMQLWMQQLGDDAIAAQETADGAATAADAAQSSADGAQTAASAAQASADDAAADASAAQTTANTAVSDAADAAAAAAASVQPGDTVLQYLDPASGRIDDWRGAPTNGLGGSGIARSNQSVNGGGATGANINAVTLYVPGEGSVSLGSASISGLTGGVRHYFFWDRTAVDYVWETTYSLAAAKMNDVTGRYIYVGSRTPGGATLDGSGSGEVP